MLALLLLGCTTDAQPTFDTSSENVEILDDSGSSEVEDVEVVPDGEDPPVTEESIGDHVLEDDWIFADDVIHEIEITLPAASIAALGEAPYSYAEGSVTFNGEVVPGIGVRLRGKIGSFRELSGKPKFKLDFNQYIEDQRFYGLETLSLNNSIVDCSYIKEHIGYALFEAVGIPASRTGIAQVQVNGAPYGLYTIIEVPDDRFVQRHYAEPDGNLYDGKYVWYGGYSYTLLDFAEGNDTLFQLEEGTDIGHADIIAVSAAIYETAGTAKFYDATSEVVDWPLLHRLWAVEQYLGQNDGYGLNTNNYRIYFDPTDDRADLVPWDLDYTFLYDWEWGLSWRSPSGRLLQGCLYDTSCMLAQQAAVAEVLEVALELDLVAQLDALSVLLDDAARNDPRRECAESSIEGEQAEVRGWLATQDATMREFWQLK